MIIQLDDLRVCMSVCVCVSNANPPYFPVHPHPKKKTCFHFVHQHIMPQVQVTNFYNSFDFSTIDL